MPFFNGKCRSAVKLVGKTALVTGCNTGIGKETVLDFYKRGARVIMACRNVEKAEEAKVSIKEACKGQSDVGDLVVVKCDLTSLRSVRECAQHVLETEAQLNILVNNAGVMMCPNDKTEDGFDMQFGTNHLSHFLLTLLLLPKIRLSIPARIVTVSSLAHASKGAHIDFDDLNYNTRPFDTSDAYYQSKLANVLFSSELARKLKEHNIEGINTYSLHPGVIATELMRHMDDTVFKGAQTLFSVFRPFIKSPKEGAQTNIYCALDEKCANETGLYYSDCVPIKPSDKARDIKLAQKLWDVSVELVGLGEYNPFTASDPASKANLESA